MTAVQTVAASDAPRRNRLLAAGLVDSIGLSIGWTVMALHAVATRGLPAFGLLSAAMLVGVALSAPFTGWLAGRMDGRRLLRSTAAAEAVLRLTGFLALLGGAPLWVVAVIVGASNVLAWTGFAGMRAEMALLGGGARWLGAYTAAIAAAEATGAFAAASLPLGPDGLLRGSMTTAVVVVYTASLIPTFLVAFGARANRAPKGTTLGQLRERRAVLLGGTAITLLASGPTLLAVGLAAGLHGRGAVGPAMLLFAIGSLTGPFLADWLGRVQLPIGVTWSFLGVLMLVGWGLAPVSIIGLLGAQLVSGIALGAFEGAMDARVATTGSPDTITSGMAWAGSARAIGSAVAVAVAPISMQGIGLGRTAAVGTMVLAASAVVSALVVGMGIRRRLSGNPPRQETVTGEPDWVLIITPDVSEFIAVSERYFGVDVCHLLDADDLPSWAGEQPPLVAVLGMAARDCDAEALEHLVGRGEAWASTRVRVLTTPIGPPAVACDDMPVLVPAGVG